MIGRNTALVNACIRFFSICKKRPRNIDRQRPFEIALGFAHYINEPQYDDSDSFNLDSNLKPCPDSFNELINQPTFAITAAIVDSIDEAQSSRILLLSFIQRRNDNWLSQGLSREEFIDILKVLGFKKPENFGLSNEYLQKLFAIATTFVRSAPVLADIFLLKKWLDVAAKTSSSYSLEKTIDALYWLSTNATRIPIVALYSETYNQLYPPPTPDEEGWINSARDAQPRNTKPIDYSALPTNHPLHYRWMKNPGGGPLPYRNQEEKNLDRELQSREKANQKAANSALPKSFYKLLDMGRLATNLKPFTARTIILTNGKTNTPMDIMEVVQQEQDRLKRITGIASAPEEEKVHTSSYYYGRGCSTM